MGLTWLFLQRLSLGLIGQMVTLCTALILRFEISKFHMSIVNMVFGLSARGTMWGESSSKHISPSDAANRTLRLQFPEVSGLR